MGKWVPSFSPKSQRLFDCKISLLMIRYFEILQIKFCLKWRQATKRTFRNYYQRYIMATKKLDMTDTFAILPKWWAKELI